MTLSRLDAAGLEEVRPAWLALCEHLDALETRMGPLRPPQELWERRRERYARWLERAPSAVFVARDREDLLGYAMVQARDAWGVRLTGDPTAELQTLSVMPHARGRGVGAALLRVAEEHLRHHGVRDLTVGVSTVNTGALRMYEREGFRPFTCTMWARPLPDVEGADGVPVDVAAPEDVDALAPLQARLGDHHAAVGPAYLPPRRDPAEAFARLRDGLAGDQSIVLRAPGGYVHATVGGGFDVWDMGRVGTVEALVVEPEARGRGVGLALLAAAVRVLRDRRVDALELEVLEGNDRARRFYERAGLHREFEELYKAL